MLRMTIERSGEDSVRIACYEGDEFLFMWTWSEFEVGKKAEIVNITLMVLFARTRNWFRRTFKWAK